jgi:hypothetical protein
MEHRDAIPEPSAGFAALQLDSWGSGSLLAMGALDDGGDGVGAGSHSQDALLKELDQELLIPSVKREQFLERSRGDPRISRHGENRFPSQRSQLPAKIRLDESSGWSDRDVLKFRQIGFQHRFQQTQFDLLHAGF